MDFKVVSEQRKLWLDELEELRLDAYENSWLYKERTKSRMISASSWQNFMRENLYYYLILG